MGESPGWRRMLLEFGAFMAVWVGYNAVLFRMVTGSWDGVPDPIWLGFVMTGLSMVNAVVTAAAGLLLAESWKEVRDRGE